MSSEHALYTGSSFPSGCPNKYSPAQCLITNQEGCSGAPQTQKHQNKCPERAKPINPSDWVHWVGLGQALQVMPALLQPPWALPRWRWKERSLLIVVVQPTDADDVCSLLLTDLLFLSMIPAVGTEKKLRKRNGSCALGSESQLLL